MPRVAFGPECYGHKIKPARTIRSESVMEEIAAGVWQEHVQTRLEPSQCVKCHKHASSVAMRQMCEGRPGTIERATFEDARREIGGRCWVHPERDLPRLAHYDDSLPAFGLAPLGEDWAQLSVSASALDGMIEAAKAGNSDIWPLETWQAHIAPKAEP